VPSATGRSRSARSWIGTSSRLSRSAALSSRGYRRSGPPDAPNVHVRGIVLRHQPWLAAGRADRLSGIKRPRSARLTVYPGAWTGRKRKPQAERLTPQSDPAEVMVVLKALEIRALAEEEEITVTSRLAEEVLAEARTARQPWEMLSNVIGAPITTAILPTHHDPVASLDGLVSAESWADTLSRACARDRCAYQRVLLGSRCPSTVPTVCRSMPAPAIARCEAQVCRRSCQRKSVMPAARQARTKAQYSVVRAGRRRLT
jgi:hypothetical protein